MNLIRNKSSFFNFGSLALYLLFSLFQQSYAKTCIENKDLLQKTINSDQSKYKIPGVEVSILCPGESSPLDFVSGTTTINGARAVTPNHLFQIGSETKSFVATIILQLEQEGALNINDPIQKYLDNLPDAWQNISIKQLLNHTSGIYNYTDVLIETGKKDGSLDLQKQWSNNELLELVFAKPLYFSPGTDWHYSNSNYILAGQIIEKGK